MTFANLSTMGVDEAAGVGVKILLGADFDDLYEEWAEEEYGEDETAPEPDYVHIGGIDSLWSEVKWLGEGHSKTEGGLTAKVESEYGGEGDGDQYWVVVSLTDGLTTRYFKRHGWYASYDGGYLEGPTVEVFPKPRMVTFYEEK